MLCFNIIHATNERISQLADQQKFRIRALDMHKFIRESFGRHPLQVRLLPIGKYLRFQQIYIYILLKFLNE